MGFIMTKHEIGHPLNCVYNSSISIIFAPFHLHGTKGNTERPYPCVQVQNLSLCIYAVCNTGATTSCCAGCALHSPRATAQIYSLCDWSPRVGQWPTAPLKDSRDPMTLVGGANSTTSIKSQGSQTQMPAEAWQIIKMNKAGCV